MDVFKVYFARPTSGTAVPVGVSTGAGDGVSVMAGIWVAVAVAVGAGEEHETKKTSRKKTGNERAVLFCMGCILSARLDSFRQK
jgi:hypothetical protein